MVKNYKRCHFFDRDGLPRGSGCPRGERCFFVHPEDRDWKDAPQSYPPKDRDRRTPPPRSPRKHSIDRSPSRRYSRRQSPSPRRYDPRESFEGESSRRSEFSDKSRRYSSDYQGQSEPKREKPPIAPRHAATAAQPHSPSLSSVTSIPLQPQPEPQPQSPSPSMSHKQPPQLHSIPPQPSTHPPLPPPPPLPAPPSFMSKRAPSPPPLTTEELRVVWSDRIRILADTVHARAELTKNEEDINTLRHLMESTLLSNFEDSDKKPMNDELSNLESRHEEIKKRFDDNISHLIKSKSWPTSPPPEVEEGEVGRQQEIMNYVEELKNAASQMNEALNDIRERRPSASDASQDATMMDIDTQENSSSRPLKRRRLPGDSYDSQHQSQYSAEELETLREKLVNVEGRLSNFETDFQAHGDDLKEHFNDRLEAKMEELQLSLVADSTPDRYREIDENVGKVEGDVSEMAGHIAGLIHTASTQEAELATTRAEIERSQNDLTPLLQRLRTYEETRERDHQAIEALKAALAAHIARPPSPPVTDIPARDYILHSIEDKIADQVHAIIRPVIEDLRSHIEMTKRTQNKEMYESLWAKLDLARRMAESISKRIEPGTQPDRLPV